MINSILVIMINQGWFKLDKAKLILLRTKKIKDIALSKNIPLEVAEDISQTAAVIQLRRPSNSVKQHYKQTFIDAVREENLKRSSGPPLEIKDMDSFEINKNPLNDLIEDEEILDLVFYIQNLDKKHYASLMLYFFFGWPASKIAKKFNVCPQIIKKRLNQALGYLKDDISG